MVTEPVLVDTSVVGAAELICLTGRRGRAVVESGVLISSVNAVRVPIADPSLRDALGSAPVAILSASKLSFRITFTSVTLMSRIFIRVVKTVVVPVTDVDPRDTVAVVTGEEVSKTSPLLTLADLFWLV